MELNVLVVDDSAVMRSMVIRSMRLSGLLLGQVHQAGDGAEGLGVLGTQKVDLALIDLNMPVMDGYEMIRRIRANPRTARLPVIVVSTDSSVAGLERIQAHGAHFIHKPFNPSTIADRIRGAVDHAEFALADGGGPSPGGLADF